MIGGQGGDLVPLALLGQRVRVQWDARLVRVFHVDGNGNRNVMSPQNFRDARDGTRTLEALSYFQSRSATLTGVGDPVELEAGFVGPGFFDQAVIFSPFCVKRLQTIEQIASASNG